MEGISDRGHLITGCIREAAQGIGDGAAEIDTIEPPHRYVSERPLRGAGDR